MFGMLLSSFAATWLSEDNRPHLGRELSDEEAIETLTSFLHGGFSAGRR